VKLKRCVLVELVHQTISPGRVRTYLRWGGAICRECVAS